MAPKPRQWRALLIVLAGIGMLTGVVLLVWLVPPALYRHVSNEQARVSAEASTRTGLIAGLAGLAALIGVSYTARTFRVTEQGQITDHYTKAIEQLGSTQLDVRLGGVYALERLMVDSVRDHPTIVEVLVAFLREHATAPTKAASAASSLLVVGSVTQKETIPPVPTPADTAAAARVIARRPRGRDERGSLDLHNCCLVGADLSRANLIDADLFRANLADANLTDANLATAKNLTQQQLNSARGDDQTKLPAGLQRPAHWSADS